MDTSMDPDVIRQQHARKIDTQERRDKLREAVPALTLRVLALQGKSYSGCGFHYDMVKSVGGLLYRLNNFDGPYDWHNASIDEVIFEGLVESVTKAEKEAR